VTLKKEDTSNITRPDSKNFGHLVAPVSCANARSTPFHEQVLIAILPSVSRNWFFEMVMLLKLSAIAVLTSEICFSFRKYSISFSLLKGSLNKYDISINPLIIIQTRYAIQINYNYIPILKPKILNHAYHIAQAHLNLILVSFYLFCQPNLYLYKVLSLQRIPLSTTSNNLAEWIS